MNRIGDAKCAIAMAARPLVRHSIALAADAVMLEVEAGAVDGDEVVDLSFQAVGEEITSAAEVARALFTDVTDEVPRTRGLHLGALKGAHDREHDGQAATI